MSYTEVLSKKSSPGIIAKLMGLDGLPPQQKGLSEDAQMKNPSRTKNETQNTFSNGLSRRSRKEKQEFKDVFEVSEPSLPKSSSFGRIQKSNLADEKMMLIRQKLADAKRLSIDQKLQDSDIFDNRFVSAGHMYSNEANMKATSTRYNGRKSFQMEGEEDLSNIATKIVILKPNLANIVSPPCYSHFFGSGFQTREFQSTPNRFTRHNRRGSQDIAKEVNTIMRSCSNSPSSWIDYYDESSCSSDESGNETEMEFLQLRNSLKSNNRQRPSFSSCKDSFVSMEAKKRMSERWKLTNISRDKDVIRRSSTLAEMLAIPAKNFVPANPDFSRIRDEIDGWNEPLGISSRDGTKVVSYEGSYRSASSSSKPGFRKSKTRTVSKVHISDKYATLEEAMKLKRDHFSLCKSKEMKRISLELHFNRSSEAYYTGLKSPSVIDKDESIENSFVSEPYEHLPESLSYEFDKCDSRPIVPNTSLVEEQTDVGQSMNISISSPDNQERLQSSAKQGTDQQSPVSILEPPFKDDFSSCSDCFNGLSADLHELRIQLQLLKLESGGQAGSGEESVLYSNDQDRLGGDECWEFSYIREVLSDFDPNESNKTWFSLDLPVSPLIFEELEKKWYGCTTQTRSERKLLFDRINGGIVEIFRPLNRISKGQIGSKWTKEGVERNLYKLLISSQETKGNGDSTEKVFERDNQWLKMGDEIEEIGEEIGRFLIDELVATELVCF